MGLGFLQGFHDDELLGEFSVDVVRRRGYDQAVDLAMLGLADEAHAIFSLLQSHRLEPPPQMGQAAAVKLFYYVTQLPSPFDHKDIDVRALELESMNNNMFHLGDPPPNFEEVTQAGFEELQSLTARLKSEDHANATTGYTAMRLSEVLTALLFMADRLGRQTDVEQSMMAMAQRIHANCQSNYFTMLLVQWEKMFIPGKLRQFLGAQISNLKDYGDFVLQTLRTRLQNGPLHADVIYKDKSIRELLEELDQNTLSDQEFNPSDYGFSDEDGGPETIFKEPATDREIQKAEKKLGRQLPEEMKEFLKISNGCHHVKSGPSFRTMRFVSVQDLYIENADYMNDYTFSLLPDFKASGREGKTAAFPESTNVEGSGEAKAAGDEEINDDDLDLGTEWCDISGGGIAMYEHDGQGTEYTWIVPAQGVTAAKARVQKVYEQVDLTQKRRIDEAIVQRYGSRKAYDEMEYCIWIQHWGIPNGQRVYPSFMSYLRGVVYDSRPNMERSPLKLSSRDL